MSLEAKGDGVDQIQRNGQWWKRQADGTWLRFDVDSAQWVASAAPPPPPPPPPAADIGPYFPLTKTRSASFAIRDLDPRLAIAAGAALLVGLIVAAFMVFGGNEPSVDLAAAKAPTAPEKKLSKKAQFIHDADELCEDLFAAVQDLDTPTNIQELVSMLQTLRTINDDATRRGTALDVPKDARAGWDRFIGHPEDGRRLDKMVASAKRGDMQTLQRLLTAMQKNGLRDREWAKDYGMEICPEGGLPQV